MTAIREVLCAMDVDRPPRGALRYAFLLAEEFRASLRVIHARGPAEQTPRPIAQPRERRSNELLVQLDAVVRTIPTVAQECATTHVVDGNVVHAVLASSSRHKSDVIVLGSTPRSAQVWKIVEPVAQQIASGTLCPVLTVPQEDSDSEPLRIQRILLPVERASRTKSGATEWAALFARRFGAVVELLHTDGCDKDRNDAAERLRAAGVPVTFTGCVARASLADCIMKRIEQAHCDLLVMGTALRHSAHFSVVANVRRSSTVPVLSIRAPGPDRLFAEGIDGERTTREAYARSRACALPALHTTQLLG
jgi:nucleotide-binding universal stress UspA family protein